ncbi:GNAT family N-acetyltransferase [Staphylococcus agnetis]|uniref:GNAT family N-acetyltransferase n=1 Tax=Staphylococcus agnetis TaxID=985762 RepID=UPI0021CF8F51|nr:N-acetyltransferase [Staphylococcus agnetis]UXU55434.1 GNAT family N-acetyltransferase [Staphylococcus agnetis]
MKFRIKKVEITDVMELRRVSIETFAEAYASDYDQALFNQYFEEEMSIEKLTGELQNPNSFFYFAMVDEHIAGYFKVNIGDAQTEVFSSQYAELQRIYLYQTYQGLKLGQYIFNYVIQFAKGLNKRYLWLGVWSENHTAIAFYKSQGLKKIGEHEFIMGNQVDVDWTMALEL